MARLHPKDADIYLDEIEFSGVMNSVDISIENPLAEVTAYADVHSVFVEGKPGFTIDVNGLWSPSSPAYDSEIFADLTSQTRQLGIYPETPTTPGSRGFEATTMVSRSPTVADHETVVGLNVTWRGETPLVESWLMYKNTAVGASENGTAYQVGALSATQQMVAVLRLLAPPGGAGNNTCDVVVASDPIQGFTTATSRIAFTQLNQASVALFEKKTVNGAITDTWWRIQVTIAGDGSRTFNLLVAIGIQKLAA